MAVLVTLGLISVLVYFVNLYMDLRERALISEKALERANDEYIGNNYNLENNSMEEKKGTRDLFLETLTRLVVSMNLVRVMIFLLAIKANISL